MTREQAFKDINETQDYYVNELINKLHDPMYKDMKEINFSSPTGTGKTKMIAKLINKLPNYYFIVTSLSRGGLYNQIAENLKNDCIYDNYVVYGVDSLKTNTNLTKEHILNIIDTKKAEGKTCIWVKDEGHIQTKNWHILTDACFKTVLFSATLNHPDICCNFTHTMMLRQVEQICGTPEDAILKLMEIKEQHKNVPNYNPCAIFRCVKNRVRKNKSNDNYDFETDEYDENMVQLVMDLCNKYKLKYLYVQGGQQDIVRNLCDDDNDCDVIINKFVITEGIDIRRACVVYLDNIPGNVATTIQVIGRCRRNALLYNYDKTNIDILDNKNTELLENTRICYAFYNADMKLAVDKNNELTMAFCNKISCQKLKVNTEIEVVKGKLSNGYEILELSGQTGKFHIVKDNITNYVDVTGSAGFNVIKEDVPEYEYTLENTYHYIKIGNPENYIAYVDMYDLVNKLPHILVPEEDEQLNYVALCAKDTYTLKGVLGNLCYTLINDSYVTDLPILGDKLRYFIYCISENKLNLTNIISDISATTVIPNYINDATYKKYIHDFVHEHRNKAGYKLFCKWLLNNSHYSSAKQICEPIYNIIMYYCCIYCRHTSWTITLTGNNRFEEVIPKLWGYCIISGLDIHTINKLCWIVFNKEDYILNCLRQVSDVVDVCLHNKSLIINKNCDYENNVLHHLKYFNVPYVTEIPQNKHITNYYIDICSTHIQNTFNLNSNFVNTCYKPYVHIKSDFESTILGIDYMKFEHDIWMEDSAVSRKVKTPTKLSAYIDIEYRTELDYADNYLTTNRLITGENNFNFTKLCNKMLGYCVEYYTKYLLYGKSYIEPYINEVLEESSMNLSNMANIDNTAILIRACMLKYKANMMAVYGTNWGKKFRYESVKIDTLLKDNYADFINTVKKLANNSAQFIKKCLYANTDVVINDIDPNLSVKHIKGLADFITPDTILDVKVQNHINEKNVRQVLAYHYLSTKRSDLNIKRVIVYDATSGKSITVNIDPKNYNKNFDENGNVIMSERLVRKELELIS